MFIFCIFLVLFLQLLLVNTCAKQRPKEFRKSTGKGVNVTLNKIAEIRRPSLEHEIRQSRPLLSKGVINQGQPIFKQVMDSKAPLILNSNDNKKHVPFKTSIDINNNKKEVTPPIQSIEKKDNEKNVRNSVDSKKQDSQCEITPKNIIMDSCPKKVESNKEKSTKDNDDENYEFLDDNKPNEGEKVEEVDVVEEINDEVICGSVMKSVRGRNSRKSKKKIAIGGKVTKQIPQSERFEKKFEGGGVKSIYMTEIKQVKKSVKKKEFEGRLNKTKIASNKQKKIGKNVQDKRTIIVKN
uniref:Uncharacterized protein n=1 Tax=Parastrongyloides trichosuri TaxID=131310 RepID=A0A0N4Z689_PARTI